AERVATGDRELEEVRIVAARAAEFLGEGIARLHRERGPRGVGDPYAFGRHVGAECDRADAASAGRAAGEADRVGLAAAGSPARDRAHLVGGAGRRRVGGLRITEALPATSAAKVRELVVEGGAARRPVGRRGAGAVAVVEEIAADRQTCAHVFEV